SKITCGVPSRYGVFNAQRTFPPSVSDSRSVATGGLATWRARRSSLSRCEAFAAMPACSEKPELSARIAIEPFGVARLEALLLLSLSNEETRSRCGDSRAVTSFLESDGPSPHRGGSVQRDS